MNGSFMINKKEVLLKRLNKLKSHYKALKEYKILIDEMLKSQDIYKVEVFENLAFAEKAIFDAYLKRFSSIQDFLGTKIFPILLDLSGISATKMTDILYFIEKEEIIDSLDNWIELRELRNELEHDYPDQMKQALCDLKKCIDLFSIIESYTVKSIDFAESKLNL